MKRVILSTKLILGDGVYRSITLSREQAQKWVDDAGDSLENFCGHETVHILGLEPDRSRKQCDYYDQALAVNAKSRLEFGREYTAEEIEEIGVEFTLIRRCDLDVLLDAYIKLRMDGDSYISDRISECLGIE